MAKKLAIKFFVSAICGAILFSPFFVLAGTYEFESDNPPKISNVQYDGFVPCGKCVKVLSGGATPHPSDSNVNEALQQLTQQYCGLQDFSKAIYVPCQFCHAFIMVNNVFWFLLKEIVPIVAVLMLVIGGAIFFFGGVNPRMVQRGRSLIWGVAIGLLLIYGSYMIIGAMFDILKLATHNPLSDVWDKGVFSINCPIKF